MQYPYYPVGYPYYPEEYHYYPVEYPYYTQWSTPTTQWGTPLGGAVNRSQVKSLETHPFRSLCTLSAHPS